MENLINEFKEFLRSEIRTIVKEEIERIKDPLLNIKGKIEGKYDWIDLYNIKDKYDYVSVFVDELARVEKDYRWGLIDITGKEVISLIYDWVGDFIEGLARVKKNNKWGFIDKTGKEVVPLKYDNVYSFKDGLARVQKDGRWFFIDKTGKEVK